MGVIMMVLAIGALLVVLFCVRMETSMEQDRNQALQYKSDCIANINKTFGTKFTNLQSEWENTQETGTNVVSVFIDLGLSRAVIIVKRLSFDQISGFKRLVGYDSYNYDSLGTISCYGHFSREKYLDIMRASGYAFNSEKLENYYTGRNNKSGEDFIIGCSSKHLLRQCENWEFYKSYFE